MQPEDNRRIFLVDARTMGRHATGIGMYAYRHLLRLMDEMPGFGFAMATDVAESRHILSLKDMGVAVYEYGRQVGASPSLFRYLSFVRDVAREISPEIFWQPNNLQPVKITGPGRIILTIHDFYGISAFDFSNALWHLYCRWAFRRTLGNITEVWFNSFRTRDEAFRLFPAMRTIENKVVHPVIDVSLAKRCAPFASGRPYFLYLGNVEKRKGADILVKAYGKYKKRGGLCDLLFAGRERNVKIPREMGGVRSLGYVDEEMKFSLLLGAKALVVPSRHEGYGMHLAEAAKLGARVISSDLPVFGEIDCPGRFVFESGNEESLARALEKTEKG